MNSMRGLILTIVVCTVSAPGLCAVEPNWQTCDLMEPEVQDALRQDLLENNCLPEVEIVDPEDTARAKRLLHRDGFVVVRDVLNPQLIDSVKERLNQTVTQILERDPQRLGNRGPLRYSFGPPHKTGHMLHYPEIAQLVEIDAVNNLLTAMFGNDKFIVRGARGDFNLPGAPYQQIHTDLAPSFMFDPAETEFPDSGRVDNRDFPLFHVVVNYVLGDLNALNAPIRQIPMTQNSHRVMPALEDEPLWMKRSTLCPVPAGSVIFRDPRAWHAGTPNLSDGIRLMPNVEYYAYWYRYQENRQMTKSMPRKIYNSLSEFGRKLCREVVVDNDDDVDFSMNEDVVYLFHDVLPCYYRMGLTDADIDRYKANGAYWDSPKTDGTFRKGFYSRLNNTQEDEKGPGKDEL